jgi:hypothetical protein
MQKRTGILLLALASAAIGGPALAHHSGAMFDRNKEVTLTGTLKEIQWVSPHAWIEILVPTADGKPQEWSVEMGGGPANFPALGITRSYPRVGDKISIVAHPLRDGRPGGSFISITLPDGRNMGQARAPTAAPAK